MRIGKCFFCDLIKSTPIQITEIGGKSVESFCLCEKCAEEYLKEPEPKLQIDDAKIAEMFEFLTQIGEALDEVKNDHCPSCGYTAEELNHAGKFGCKDCYDHFKTFMVRLVYPYHNHATQHVGKRPKSWLQQKMEEPTEKLKCLRLNLAKALELEKYELIPEIKRQIAILEQTPSSCEDQ